MNMVEATSAIVGFPTWRSAVEASAERGVAVEVYETATSWVLLTNRHAYKIKKAIDLGAVSWQSLVRRRQACIDEVWLNRRLAPGVYLGVVPLARDAAGEIRISGKGTPIEWAVKMRRLRGDRKLSWLIKHNQLTPTDIRTLADVLANFYFGNPPETARLDDLCQRLKRRIEDVDDCLWSPLPEKLRRTVERVRAAQREYLEGARPTLNLRVCDGRVVDGHGDLRPEHIFLERQPAIIDCIEYSAERRKCDALDDLSALTMECQRRSRDDVAEALMTAYRQRTGDEALTALEAFFRSTHACTRAKQALTASSRATEDPQQLAEAASYLIQAERDVAQIK